MFLAWRAGDGEIQAGPSLLGEGLFHSLRPSVHLHTPCTFPVAGRALQWVVQGQQLENSCCWGKCHMFATDMHVEQPKTHLVLVARKGNDISPCRNQPLAAPSEPALLLCPVHGPGWSQSYCREGAGCGELGVRGTGG